MIFSLNSVQIEEMTRLHVKSMHDIIIMILVLELCIAYRSVQFILI